MIGSSGRGAGDMCAALASATVTDYMLSQFQLFSSVPTHTRRQSCIEYRRLERQPASLSHATCRSPLSGYALRLGFEHSDNAQMRIGSQSDSKTTSDTKQHTSPKVRCRPS